jgi:protein TonB
MKRLQPVLFLLFICTVCLNKNAAAQVQASTTTNVDTTEEIVIGCSFPPIQAGFLGGDSAWQRFVTRHLVYPKEAISKKIQGIVTVQFLVGKDGSVSDVEALDGPKELRQSAIDVVMKSRKWYPAVQGGRNVNECKQLDIVFKLPTE